MNKLALDRPDWRIILIGPVQSKCDFPSNVELPGQVAHAKLAAWLIEADIILLPCVLHAYTDAVMPAKTYEVLASGLPIVAAPLGELTERFSHVMHFTKSPAGWADAVERALDQETPEKRAQRKILAEKNSWLARYDEFKVLLGNDKGND
ncbi:MAG: glycosyltransferase [Candidatus Synoicihabitans palmerolidicus]|nr:glycosyltransferase [Candidatus Synoicihabitans palmerolidicus]